MDETRRKGADPAGIVIAVVLMILAGVIWWDMASLQISSVYGLGPKAMPIVIASGLGLLAIGNFVLALKRDIPEPDEADPKAILLIVGGLAALIALIGLGGGFIPATAILFATTAAAFGRKAFLTDLAIGFGLGVVIFLLFVKLLTLSLPAGPLERLF
jgi:putative tricarboxylic transport membrane protein